MKKNILIIGKKSFIGSNLLLNLKHKHCTEVTDIKNPKIKTIRFNVYFNLAGLF